MDKPAFDIVVFGATSFVGQLVCRYMAERYGDDGDVCWAMAGRSKQKLGKVRSGGPGGRDIARECANIEAFVYF